MSSQTIQQTMHTSPGGSLALGLRLFTGRSARLKPVLFSTFPFLAFGGRHPRRVKGIVVGDEYVEELNWPGFKLLSRSGQVWLPDSPSFLPVDAQVKVQPEVVGPSADATDLPGVTPRHNSLQHERPGSVTATGQHSLQPATPALGLMLTAATGVSGKGQGPALFGVLGQRATGTIANSRSSTIVPEQGVERTTPSASSKLAKGQKPTRPSPVQQPAAMSIVNQLAARLASTGPQANQVMPTKGVIGRDADQDLVTPVSQDAGGVKGHGDAMDNMRPAVLPRQDRFSMALPMLSLLPGLALRSADATTDPTDSPGDGGPFISSANELDRLMHQGIALPHDRGGVQSSSLLSATSMPSSYGGLATAHAVSATVEAIGEVVQQKVDAAVEAQASSLSPIGDQGPAQETGTTTQFSDEAVRTLMQQMSELAQDERFRSGKLR